ATLYVLDEDGRMVATNEAARPPAPRLFLGRTREGNVWHLRRDLSSELVRELADLLAAEPIADDPRVEPRCLPALRAAPARPAPIEREGRGPAYLIPARLDAPIDPAPGEGEADQATLRRPACEGVVAG